MTVGATRPKRCNFHFFYLRYETSSYRVSQKLRKYIGKKNDNK